MLAKGIDNSCIARIRQLSSRQVAGEYLDVLIIHARLDQCARHLPRLWEYLSLDERGRTARQRTDRGRRVSIVSRGILRWIVGYVLGIQPHDVRLTRSPCGKPLLDGSHNNDLEFSVSHAGNWICYALTWGRTVGIDIEPVEPPLVDELLCSTVWTASESSFLQSLSETEWPRALFRQWVRKEAVLKALGSGLSTDPRQVNGAQDDGAKFATLKDPQGRQLSWRIGEFQLDEGQVVGAVAVEGSDCRITKIDLCPSMMSWPARQS